MNFLVLAGLVGLITLGVNGQTVCPGEDTFDETSVCLVLKDHDSCKDSGVQKFCGKTCCSPPSGICEVPVVSNSNHAVIGRQVPVGESVTFKCDEGFKLEGEPELTCVAERKFNRDAPKCVPDDSPPQCDLPLVVNSNLEKLFSVIRIDFGSAISFICNPGFVLVGNERLRCEATKEFDLPPPICEKSTDPCVLKEDARSSDDCQAFVTSGFCTQQSFFNQCAASCCQEFAKKSVHCPGKLDILEKSTCQELLLDGSCTQREHADNCAATCPCFPEERCTRFGPNQLSDSECEESYRAGKCVDHEMLRQCATTCPCPDESLANPEACFDKASSEICERRKIACDSEAVYSLCQCTCGRCARNCTNRFRDEMCEEIVQINATSCLNLKTTRVNCRRSCSLCHVPTHCENALGDAACEQKFPNPERCEDELLSSDMDRCAKRCRVCTTDPDLNNLARAIERDFFRIEDILKKEGIVLKTKRESISEVHFKFGVGNAINLVLRGNNAVVKTCIGCPPLPSLPQCPSTIQPKNDKRD